MTASTILSPHLDDAVLSCWHVLSGPDRVRVLNVFTATPTSPPRNAWWDHLTGTRDYARRMEDRREEDRTALALAGAENVDLGFLDEQYREKDPSVESVRDAIAEHLAPGSVLYAPAGLLMQRGDHALVRSAALDLHRRGVDVLLYADLPHAVQFGWPTWLNGGASPLDVDALWEWELAAGLISYPSLKRRVHALSPEAMSTKLKAMRSYRSQLPALEHMFGAVDRTSRLAYELSWELPR